MSVLAAALVAAQAEMPRLHKDSEAEVVTQKGAKYKYQYLSLETLLEQVLPVLNRHGIALIQAPVWDDRGFHALSTTLLHESGEDHVSFMRLPVASDAAAQVLGSAITYGRRYAVLSVLALAPDEDDDGATAQRAGANEVRNREPSEGASLPPDGDGPQAGEPRPAGAPSEGFQAPATEKPVTQGVLDELAMILRLLDTSFPEHPGENRKWADVAREHTRDLYQVNTSTDLTLAQGHELRGWLEDQYTAAAKEASIPFG